MLIIKLPQDHYSETVVRKSLYWCEPDSNWTLTLEEGNWVISVTESDASFGSILHKHLNDFLLHEKLSIETRSLRENNQSLAVRGDT